MMFLVLLTSVIMVEPRAGGVTEEQKEDCPIKRKKKLFRWIYMSQSVFSFRCPALALQRYKLFGKFPHVPPLPLQIFPLLLFWLATASLLSLISCWTSRLNLKDKQHIIRRGVGLGITGFKVHFQKEIIVGPQEVLFLWFFKQVSSTHYILMSVEIQKMCQKGYWCQYCWKAFDHFEEQHWYLCCKFLKRLSYPNGWFYCFLQLRFHMGSVLGDHSVVTPIFQPKLDILKCCYRLYDSASKCKELLTKLKKQLFQQ